jgi:hypothetical protein
MLQKIQNKRDQILKLEIEFNSNPNSKNAKKLSDSRMELFKLEKEYRSTPEFKKQERTEIMMELRKIANKISTDSFIESCINH